MLGKWVRAERERRGWSQAYLAQQAGMVQPYLSRLEQGHQDNPGGKVLQGLAKAFGLSIDEMLGAAGLGSPTPPDELTTLLQELTQTAGVPQQVIDSLQEYRRELHPQDEAAFLGFVRNLAQKYRTQERTSEAAPEERRGTRGTEQRGHVDPQQAALYAGQGGPFYSAAPAQPGDYSGQGAVHEAAVPYKPIMCN